MKVNAIKCPKCHDTIYSRARHDFRRCSCGNIFIDGGLDYIHMGGDITVKSFKLKIKATPKELFNDWNLKIDKLGLIKNVKKVESIDKLFEEIETKRKAHPIYYFFHDIYWRVYHYIEMIPLRVKSFFQRGFRGYANSDTWDFAWYLSEVISKGVKNLKKNGHHDIEDIDKIIKTFETAKGIAEGDIIYIPSGEFEWAKYKRWKRSIKQINKKYKVKNKVTTKRESIEFEKGFDIFKKEFFRLWD